MPASHTGVHPVRITYHSVELATDVRRTVGFEGYCACGWQGQVRREHSHARDDSRRHRREQHGAEEATGGTEAS